MSIKKLPLLFLLLALSPIAMAVTFTVTKQSDSNDGGCSVVDCSLREAVIAANNTPGNDTIIVPAGHYVLSIPGRDEDLAASGDLDVLDDVVIQGQDPESTIIDAAGIDRVFHLKYLDSLLNVTLTQLTIRGGKAEHPEGGSLASGGGILVAGVVEPVIDHVIVTDNIASGWGGGIGHLGSSMLVLDSVVQANRLVADDESGELNGGGIGMTNADLVMWRTRIVNNTIETTPDLPASGGGVGCTHECDIQIYDSTFEQNSVTGSDISVGGGFAVTGDRAKDILFLRNTVARNSAERGGGVGIDADALGFSEIRMSNSTITENVASEGGGIYLRRPFSETVLNHVTITDNVAKIGSARSGNASAEIENSVLIGDCATAAGPQPFFSNGGNLESPGNTCFDNPVNDLVNVGSPGVLPLANNGGLTETQALVATSLAVDQALFSHCAAVDQRGVARYGGSACDAGAYESKFGRIVEDFYFELNPDPYIYIYMGDPAPYEQLPLDQVFVPAGGVSVLNLRGTSQISYSLEQGPTFGRYEFFEFDRLGDDANETQTLAQFSYIPSRRFRGSDGIIISATDLQGNTRRYEVSLCVGRQLKPRLNQNQISQNIVDNRRLEISKSFKHDFCPGRKK